MRERACRWRALLVTTQVVFGALVAAGGVPAVAQESKSNEAEVLRLEEAIDLSLKRNRRVEVADLQVRIALQQLIAQRTARLPVTAAGGIATARIVPASLGGGAATPPVPGNLPVVLDQPRLNALPGLAIGEPIIQREIGLKIRLQKEKVSAARDALRLEEQNAAAQVKKGYYGLIETQASSDAVAEELKANQELERTVSDRVKQGSALQVDLMEVHAKSVDLEHELLLLRHQYSAGQEDLNRLMGRDVDRPFRVATPPAVPPTEEDRQTLQQIALRQRPEVLAAANKYRQARINRQLAKAQYIPSLTAGLIYLHPLQIPSLPDDVFMFGTSLVWEPWDWGRRRADVRAAGLAISQSGQEWDEVEAQVRIDVNTQFRAVQAAQDEIQAAFTNQQAAEARMRVTQMRYGQQLALLSDVLKAQSALEAANSRYKQALTGHLNAMAQLSRAIGEQ